MNENLLNLIIKEAYEDAYNDIMNEGLATKTAVVGGAGLATSLAVRHHKLNVLNNKSTAKLAYKKAKAQGKTGGLSFKNWVEMRRRQIKKRTAIGAGVSAGVGAAGVAGHLTANNIRDSKVGQAVRQIDFDDLF